MKAWLVTNPDASWDDDYRADLVRANTKGKARFNNELVAAGIDPLGLKITRQPAADGDGSVTERILIENGFSVECTNCYTLVRDDMEDEEDDNGHILDGPVYDAMGRAYCSTRCLEVKRRKRLVQEAS